MQDIPFVKEKNEAKLLPQSAALQINKLAVQSLCMAVGVKLAWLLVWSFVGPELLYAEMFLFVMAIAAVLCYCTAEFLITLLAFSALFDPGRFRSAAVATLLLNVGLLIFANLH